LIFIIAFSIPTQEYLIKEGAHSAVNKQRILVNKQLRYINHDVYKKMNIGGVQVQLYCTVAEKITKKCIYPSYISYSILVINTYFETAIN